VIAVLEVSKHKLARELMSLTMTTLYVGSCLISTNIIQTLWVSDTQV